jgi:hypothetical protein
MQIWTGIEQKVLLTCIASNMLKLSFGLVGMMGISRLQHLKS